jgi:putative transposase
MARAKRHFLPGHVWHITHRCHKKEFLFKFVKDRNRWRYWLFQAKKRYGLKVLNYMVTSNHIHLLVVDKGSREVIPRSIQLIAGRTGQEYNQRKKRNGAFWEDRYHATAIQSDAHLIKCLTYIDLNMVRAGVVKHPQEWNHSGYNEILRPRERYGIIDFTNLMSLLQIETHEALKEAHKKWINEALKRTEHTRESLWTQSIAVGDKSFVEKIKEILNLRTKGRLVQKAEEVFHLSEKQASYGTFDFQHIKNEFFWNSTNQLHYH